MVSRQKMDTTVQLTSVFDIHMTKENVYFVFWDSIGDGEQVNIVKLAVKKRETFQAKKKFKSMAPQGGEETSQVPVNPLYPSSGRRVYVL